MPVPARAQVVTAAPDGSGEIKLGTVGTIASLKWSSTYPGGPDQMSCLLQTRATSRDPAIQAGRQIRVHAGVNPSFDGILDEPTPGEDGWQIVAHGSGTFGGQFLADWSGVDWGPTAPDQAVNNAIGRPGPALRWVNPGIGAPPGMWLGQSPDQGTDTITDLLNLICSRGGLGWQVRLRATGNTLSVAPIPTAVTRVLAATGPVPVTVAGLVNAVCVRYCSKKDDSAGTASYAVTWVPDDLPGSDPAKAPLSSLIGQYGRNEKSLDLSNATKPGGALYSAAEVRAVAVYCLQRYQQAAWAGPFTPGHGDYLTASGTPVNLACERAGEVVQLVGADYGGQVTGLPPVFVVGGYEYDEETGRPTITPLGAVRTDWSALVASRTDFWTDAKDPFGLKSGAA